MTTRDFLEAILGEAGLNAIEKACRDTPKLDTILLPRTIFAWLQNQPDTFDSTVPGSSTIGLTFTKSEDSYTGSLSMDVEKISFEKATDIHLTSCLAVALGLEPPDQIECDQKLIKKLGSVVEKLIKARSKLAEMKKMALKDIQVGRSINEAPGRPLQEWDYSHVLSPEHRKNGYSLKVLHNKPRHMLEAALYRSNKETPLNALRVPGGVAAHLTDKGKTIEIGDAEIPTELHNQKFGKALYEALMAHAHNHMGAQHVMGDFHSTLAGRVHEALARKHGLEYKPRISEENEAVPPGPYDFRMDPYHYALKSEMKPGQGAEAPGPSAAAKAPAPPNGPQPPNATQDQKGPPPVGLRPSAPKPPRPSSPSLATKLPGPNQKGVRKPVSVKGTK